MLVFTSVMMAYNFPNSKYIQYLQRTLLGIQVACASEWFSPRIEVYINAVSRERIKGSRSRVQVRSARVVTEELFSSPTCWVPRLCRNRPPPVKCLSRSFPGGARAVGAGLGRRTLERGTRVLSKSRHLLLSFYRPRN